MILTKEEIIRRHRMMWGWIGEETLKTHTCVDKYDAFKNFEWKRTRCHSMCWCCEYANGISSDWACDQCPIEWPGNSEAIRCLDYYKPFSGKGIFDMWCKAANRKDWRTAAYYALYISMLPERKD